MRSKMTWPVSCTRPWNPPTYRCGSANATETGSRQLPDQHHAMPPSQPGHDARTSGASHPEPASPQIAAGEHVKERHKRDEAEDSPRQLPAACHVGAGGQVDPHEDNSERVEEADQQFEELLHAPESTSAGMNTDAQQHPH